MGAKYIFRLDDINPSMNWNEFHKYINLFKKYNIKPLIGVIPDNQDKEIKKNEFNDNFWKIIKDLVDSEAIDISQHGYQHQLFPTSIQSPHSIGVFSKESEFSGLSRKEQYEKVLKGKNIMQEYGVESDIWMSPAHTLDDKTIEVLVDLGFKIITDGSGLFPFKSEKILFVPQQFERPRRMPIGVITFCIHTNNSSDIIYQDTEKLLESSSKDCISIRDVKVGKDKLRYYFINKLFQFFLIKIRLIKLLILDKRL